MHNLPRQEVINLLNRIAAGDDKAGRKLYAAYRPGLLRYVLRKVWSVDCAEEICADTLYIAFRKTEAYQGSAEFSTWLCGIANMRILDWRSRNGRAPPEVPLDGLGSEEEPSGEWNVLDLLEQAEVGEMIAACLDKLPEGQREAMYRVVVDDMGLAELSGQMQVAEGTLKSRLFHARQRIRDCLARALGSDYHGAKHV
jgi:RNA polymerase sigma-70 factor (ECF subfamily)